MKHALLPALAMALTTFVATPSLAHPLEGSQWLTDSKKGIVRIQTCAGGKICGTIVRVMPAPGENPVDARNPNPSLRTRAIQGINILTGFTLAKDGKYTGGQIYNPEDGKTYRSEFRLKPDGKLEVKGCVGPICQGRIWTRAN